MIHVHKSWTVKSWVLSWVLGLARRWNEPSTRIVQNGFVLSTNVPNHEVQNFCRYFCSTKSLAHGSHRLQGLVVLLLLLLLTSLYECSSLKDELEQLTRRHAGVAKKSHERMEETRPCRSGRTGTDEAGKIPRVNLGSSFSGSSSC